MDLYTDLQRAEGSSQGSANFPALPAHCTGRGRTACCGSRKKGTAVETLPVSSHGDQGKGEDPMDVGGR